MVATLGYEAKQVAVFARAYRSFYNMYDLLIAEGEQEKFKNFGKDMSYLFNQFIFKFSDVVEQEGILKDMYSKIKELNEKYNLEIKTPDLEHLLKKDEVKKE